MLPIPADAGPEAAKRIRELEEENARLRARVAELEEMVKRLVVRIEELERAGKRQASPFSKGPPKKDPKRPGRKPGSGYGEHVRGIVPDHIDHETDVPLPFFCPDCGGLVVETAVAHQFQVDVPKVRPETRRFWVHIGACSDCGRRVQPRHPLQTSDALGAAAVQVGPNALTLATLLSKSFAVPWRKIATFMHQAFGLAVGASTLCRATLRLGERLEPTYHALVRTVSQSPVVYADETGWKTGGHKRWLWVFTTLEATVYKIAPSRGGDVILSVLGKAFSGILGRDGWAAYVVALKAARFQSCLAHFFRRAEEILEVAQQGAARFAHAVERVLHAALELRDRRDELSEHGFATLRGKVEANLDRLIAWHPTYEPNAKFVKHLRNERPHLLTFLHEPSVEATNWPAEQAVRPGVLARKISGGTRTDRGSKAHAILTSVLRTAGLQRRDARELLLDAFRAGRPITLNLTISTPSG